MIRVKPHSPSCLIKDFFFVVEKYFGKMIEANSLEENILNDLPSGIQEMILVKPSLSASSRTWCNLLGKSKLLEIVSFAMVLALVLVLVRMMKG